MRYSFFFLISLISLIRYAYAQTTTAEVFEHPDVNMKRAAGRANAVAKIRAIEEDHYRKNRAKAKALGLQLRVVKPNGGVREIVDFEGDRPVYLTTKNQNAAISTSANLVRSSPYSLDGTGMITGVWDGGSVRTSHQEFNNGSRVSIMDGSALNAHATHVGGTIAAQGTRADARGMASGVIIHSYDWTSDQSEMTSRAATSANQFDTKIYLSNHSYGYADGWDGNEWLGSGSDQNATESAFGQYAGICRNLDSIAYNAPYYNMFWSAGNDRSNNPSTGANVVIGGVTVAYNPAIHPPGDGVYRNGFETIGSHGNAKNLVVIGAVNDAVTSGLRDSSKASLTSFSSTGPTDDGRIKPDLVANGASLTSTSSSGDINYATMSGTSMASPNATGSAVLVMDQYKRLYNRAIRASTLKGLLIHTASDIGNPGPDYRNGWGLIDTKKAVDLVRDHHAFPLKSRINEDQVTSSISTRIHSFVWDGLSPLRATLCWTDPAGASINLHDSRASVLVNNLNLKLIAPNGVEHFPYVMPFVGTWTVASMNQNATTGVNNTDNVETVDIQNPGQVGSWQAVVSYTGLLANSNQSYGLLISGSTSMLNTVNVNLPNGGETFYKDDTYPVSWTSNVSGNVSIELLKSGVLQTVLSANEVNDGLYSWTIPSSLPSASDYTLRIRSVDNPSYLDTSHSTFTILTNPLAEALDTLGIAWTSTSGLPWFSQTTTTFDGVDAAQSGAIGHSASSSLEGNFTGPGILNFRWKVSSETNYDFLVISINGVEQTGSLAKISGNINWVLKEVTIPTGSHTIRWAYTKDSSEVRNLDAAWVDQIVFTPDSAPEIAIEQPLGNALTDGVASLDLGSVNTGESSVPMTFTIRNTGNSILNGLSLAKSGTYRADYSISSLGSSSLLPGTSTTFTVTFTPSQMGNRMASIEITSNDSDENPFDIQLTGNGIAPGVLTVTPIGDFNATGKFGGVFSPSSMQYILSNSGSSSIDWSVAKTQTWLDLSTYSGTLPAGGNTTITASINSGANILNVGTYSELLTFSNLTNQNGNTTRAVSLGINPASATVTFGTLSKVYNGSNQGVIVNTQPPGLSYLITYDGSSNMPSQAGIYAVVVTITDVNFTGSNSGLFLISKAPQTIAFGELSSVLDSAPSFSLEATNDSGLPVSFSSSNINVATLSENTVNIVESGSTIITASQQGDANYLPASEVSQILRVNRSKPLADMGGSYSVIAGQFLSLNGSNSVASHNETLVSYEWDLNNDDMFGDVLGPTPNAISYATLVSVWGRIVGNNTIQLKVTDTSGKSSITSTTLSMIETLTWDANGAFPNQVDGTAAWLSPNQWWTGSSNVLWSNRTSARIGNGGVGGAIPLSSPISVNSFLFESFTGTYTLGTTAQSLSIDHGIEKSPTSGVVSILSPILLGEGQVWSNLSTGALTAFSTTDNAGFPLVIEGSGNISFGVINNEATSLLGSGALIMNGSGIVSIGGVNSNFLGDVVVYDGTLRVHAPGSITGNVNLVDGIYEHYWNNPYTRSLGAGAGQIRITGGSSGFSENGNTSMTVTLNNSSSSEVIWGSEFFDPDVFVLQSDSAQQSSALTFANPIDLNGSTRVVHVSGGTTGNAVATISRVVRSSSGKAGLTKTGSGMLTLSALNTYDGDTTVSAGTLRLSYPNASNDSSTVSISPNAKLQLNFNGNDAVHQLFIGNIQMPAGTYKAIGSSVGGIELNQLLGTGTLSVASGPVDHFEISSIGPLYKIGESINGITISARGSANEVVSSFTGKVTFSGSAGVTGVSANFIAGVLSGLSITPERTGLNLTFNVDDGAGHTGSAIFTIQSLFDHWAGNSGLVGNESQANANPDGDNFANIQEFAFGLDPNSSLHSPLNYERNGNSNAGTPIIEDTGGIIRAVFTRRKDYEMAGLNYQVLFSADLITWTAANRPPIRLSGENSDSIETVGLEFPEAVPLGAGGESIPQFFRVIVTTSEPY